MIKSIIEKFGSFVFFAKSIYKKSKNFKLFLSKFVSQFREPKKSKKNIFGTGELTSQKCFKRYLLFFRWVVLDLELWNFIPKHDLLAPIDVSVLKTLSRIGLIKFKRDKNGRVIRLYRSDCVWRDVLRTTRFFYLINPLNPLSLDFYLARLGLLGICNSKKCDSKCDICPLMEFCIY